MAFAKMLTIMIVLIGERSIFVSSTAESLIFISRGIFVKRDFIGRYFTHLLLYIDLNRLILLSV
jgi:hypothetical protein